VGIPASAVPFAFDWRVFDGEGVIASGTGRNGATGIIDTGTHALGGGPLQSRALAFGTFAALANRLYTLEFQPAAEMTAVLRAKPSLEVVLQTRTERPDFSGLTRRDVESAQRSSRGRRAT
jgi:hypothetical protein